MAFCWPLTCLVTTHNELLSEGSITISILKADWASEASPTWAIHLGFFIYYILLSYVRRGLCDPFFFFLRRALCAVQSSCTVLFRCARPTHALHASSNSCKSIRYKPVHVHMYTPVYPVSLMKYMYIYHKYPYNFLLQCTML